MIFVVIILAIVVGFFAAVPVGASQLEIVRRCLAGYEREAFILLGGCVTVDIAYGMFALFGLAPFIEQQWVTVTLRIAGGIVMMFIGVQAIRESRVTQVPTATEILSRPAAWTSFTTGLTFSGTNPVIVVAWLFAFKTLSDWGLSSPTNATVNATFVIACVAGMSSYMFLLTRIVRRLHKFLVPKTIQVVIKWCGVFLIVCGAVLMVRTVITLWW